MRPRKDVLLLMRDEEELGLWRHRVELWGYRAHACDTTEEALAWMSQFPVHAIATDVPAAAERLVLTHDKVLLFDAPPGVVCGAYSIEWSGPELVARVRERLRILTQRKRGPAKKPVVSVAVEEREEKCA